MVCSRSCSLCGERDAAALLRGSAPSHPCIRRHPGGHPGFRARRYGGIRLRHQRKAGQTETALGVKEGWPVDPWYVLRSKLTNRRVRESQRFGREPNTGRRAGGVAVSRARRRHTEGVAPRKTLRLGYDTRPRRTFVSYVLLPYYLRRVVLPPCQRGPGKRGFGRAPRRLTDE